MTQIPVSSGQFPGREQSHTPGLESDASYAETMEHIYAEYAELPTLMLETLGIPNPCLEPELAVIMTEPTENGFVYIFFVPITDKYSPSLYGSGLEKRCMDLRCFTIDTESGEVTPREIDYDTGELVMQLRPVLSSSNGDNERPHVMFSLNPGRITADGPVMSRTSEYPVENIRFYKRIKTYTDEHTNASDVGHNAGVAGLDVAA